MVNIEDLSLLTPYEKAIFRMVSKMEAIPGYPRTPLGLEGYVESACDIFQDQPHKEKTALETAQEIINTARMSADKMPTIPDLCEMYTKAGYRPAYEGPVTPEMVARVKDKFWVEPK